MAKGITVRELADVYFTVHCTHPVTQKSGRTSGRCCVWLEAGRPGGSNPSTSASF